MIQWKRAINAGLLAGASLIFLVLIGIPGGANDADGLPAWFTWVLFAIAVGGFAFSATRLRTVTEQRSLSALKRLQTGIIVGSLAAALVITLMCAVNAAQLWEIALKQSQTSILLPSGLRINITRVQDVLANVTSRTTAIMSGKPLDAIAGDSRADPLLGFFLMGCLLPLAGAVGAGAGVGWNTFRTRPRQEQQIGAISWLHWGTLLLPLIFFAIIIFNSITTNADYKTLLGNEGQQLLSLLACFFMIASGLFAIRAPNNILDETRFRVRGGILIAITLVLFGIGLAAPSRPVENLMFNPASPNPIQIAAADGTFQVITPAITPISTDTLLLYRHLVIGFIGLLFVLVSLITAASKFSLRSLVTLTILIGTFAVVPLYIDTYQQTVLLLVGINVLLGLGLNIVVGYAGLLDLGYVAFYAIGAYTYAFLASNEQVLKGATVVGLKFGGNDQFVAQIAAAMIIGLLIALIVIGGGLLILRRRRAATHQLPRLPRWSGYILILITVTLSLIVISLLRGTSFYDSFSYFPAFIVSIVVGIFFAALAGILLGIPVLRLRGDYLAIVTLGFGEIIRLFLNNLSTITGGPQGVTSIPHPTIGNVEIASNEGLLYLVLVGCLLVAFISLRLKSSRLGRAWSALKSDEDIAQAMGVNLVNAKVLAFAIGAAFAGIGGVLFAARQSNIAPNDFTLPVSINILSLIIIGGMGSIPGVVIGALILIGVPETLRVFETYRILAFGMLLVAMMLLRPEGLLPAHPPSMERRARDLVGVPPEAESTPTP